MAKTTSIEVVVQVTVNLSSEELEELDKLMLGASNACKVASHNIGREVTEALLKPGRTVTLGKVSIVATYGKPDEPRLSS
jgi:hypothetical protein